MPDATSAAPAGPASSAPSGAARPFARALRGVALGSAMLLAACQTELYDGQTDRSVNEMIAVLASNGIEARRVPGDDGLYGITVPRNQFARSITLLSERGLPRLAQAGMDAFDCTGGIVTTPFQERACFMKAISQELSLSLTDVAGVVNARVHVNVPEDQPLSDEKIASTAAVFIYKDPSIDLSGQVSTIKTLVTNAVDGLDYEDVAVAVFDARSPAAPFGSGRAGVSIPALVGYGVLALVALFLWRKLTSRRPTRRIVTEGAAPTRRGRLLPGGKADGAARPARVGSAK